MQSCGDENILTYITSNRKASRAIPAMSCSASARDPYGSLMWTMCSWKQKTQQHDLKYAGFHSDLWVNGKMFSSNTFSFPWQVVGSCVTHLHGEPFSIDGVL